jgi:hypothetical protein
MKLGNEEIIQLETVLVEILTVALKCHPSIRPMITDVAIGIADLLPEDAVTRAKEYSMYRARKETV